LRASIQVQPPEPAILSNSSRCLIEFSGTAASFEGFLCADHSSAPAISG
jgi:hypothetical protein